MFSKIGWISAKHAAAIFGNRYQYKEAVEEQTALF